MSAFRSPQDEASFVDGGAADDFSFNSWTRTVACYHEPISPTINAWSSTITLSATPTTCSCSTFRWSPTFNSIMIHNLWFHLCVHVIPTFSSSRVSMWSPIPNLQLQLSVHPNLQLQLLHMYAFTWSPTSTSSYRYVSIWSSDPIHMSNVSYWK